MTDERPTRRRILATVGTTAVAGLAGCGGSVVETDERSTDGSCPTDDSVDPATTDWRGELGTATNAGTVSADAVPEGELTVDWTVPVKTNVGHHVPIVVDGTLYAHDLDDELSAFDASTGELQWTREITDPVMAPAVDGDTLVVTTESGVRAFDASTGAERWSRSGLAGGVFDASPVVADGTVYLQRGVATHALALATGETRWRSPTGLPSDSTPAVTGETVFTAGDDTYVRALAATDGTEQWRTKADARIECNVSVAGDTAFAGTESGDVVALDAATGSERWRHQLASPPSGDDDPERPETITNDGSRVYVTTDTTLAVLAVEDGSRCWRTRSYKGGYASTVAVGGGRVFVPTARTDVELAVFDAATGDRLQGISGERLQHSAIGPSLAEGGVFLAGDDAVVRLS